MSRAKSKKFIPEPEIKFQKTKTLTVKKNGKIADFLTPNFVYGCMGGCRNTFCYVMRYNYAKIYVNENREKILEIVSEHAYDQERPKKPTHCDPDYYLYEIGIFTDVGLHRGHLPWKQIFEMFIDHPYAKAAFSSKYLHPELLTIRPEGKIRIRINLMPEEYSKELETNTMPIAERLAMVEPLRKAGYEVDLDFGPIVVGTNDWLKQYEQLFIQVHKAVPESIRDEINAHCSFLTHNKRQHKRNVQHGMHHSEKMIRRPGIMQGGRRRISRYLTDKRKKYISERTRVHNMILPRNRIRRVG